MKRALIPVAFIAIVVVSFLFISPVRERIGTADSAKIGAAANVLTQAMSTMQSGIPESVLVNSRAIAVIPRMFRQSILYSRGYGEGILIVRKEEGTWSSPVFIDFIEGNAGLDRDLRPFDVILFFTRKAPLDLLERNNLILGKNASTALGPVGNDTEFAPNRSNPEIYYYTRVQNELAKILLDGAVLRVDDYANEDFYNLRHVTPRDIVAGRGTRVPFTATRLACAVAKYTGTAQICG